jgi:phosphate transport system permease protein
MASRKPQQFSGSAWVSRFLDAMEPMTEWTIFICGWSAIVFVLAIFGFVLREALPVIGTIDLWNFFSSAEWRPDSAIKPSYGILALLCGSISVTFLAMLMAVPIGLGAAIYLSEFAPHRSREVLKVVIELLAAIPSIVWGFLGIVAISPLLTRVFGISPGVNALNGGIILALMSVPVIVSVGEDALKAVPDAYREAAYALGASRWEVVYKVLFPAARHGLLAAVLLGIGRAIGETMAVLLCTGHSVRIPTTVMDPVRTITATIAAELGEAVHQGDHYRVLFLLGVVLFALTFAVNLTADLIVKGIRGGRHA